MKPFYKQKSDREIQTKRIKHQQSFSFFSFHKKKSMGKIIGIFFLLLSFCVFFCKGKVIEDYDCFVRIEDKKIENFNEWTKSCHPDKWASKDIMIDQQEILQHQLLEWYDVLEKHKQQQQQTNHPQYPHKKKKFGVYDEKEKILFYLRLAYGLIFFILLLFLFHLSFILALVLLIFLGWKLALLFMVLFFCFYKLFLCFCFMKKKRKEEIFIPEERS